MPLRRYDRHVYKQRNTVERCIDKHNQWRGLATRCDKNAMIYRAGLVIAAIHSPWAEHSLCSVQGRIA